MGSGLLWWYGAWCEPMYFWHVQLSHLAMGGCAGMQSRIGQAQGAITALVQVCSSLIVQVVTYLHIRCLVACIKVSTRW
jgi:hypothetical protein